MLKKRKALSNVYAMHAKNPAQQDHRRGEPTHMESQLRLQGLRRLRLAQNLSQGELADLLGVSIRQVNRWENLVCHPRGDLPYRLCQILKCTISDLYGFSGVA